MKTCKRCCEIKPKSEFYDNDSSCKTCRCAIVRFHRLSKLNDPQWVEREIARQREKERKRRKLGIASKPDPHASKRWAAKNKEKRKSHLAVNHAVRSGRLIPQPCEVCGCRQSEAHHDDYSRPLDVRWLCTTHHAEHHVNQRRILRLKNAASAKVSTTATP